jgi:hypothetical protein
MKKPRIDNGKKMSAPGPDRIHEKFISRSPVLAVSALLMQAPCTPSCRVTTDHAARHTIKKHEAMSICLGTQYKHEDLIG